MADTNTPMNEDAFLRYRVQFGADIMVWPDDIRKQALAFTATPDGMQLQHSEQTLDEAFVSAVAVSGAIGSADDPAAARFLSRLEDIPDQHPRPGFVAPKAPVFVGWAEAVSRFLESGKLWTPLGISAQAAACAVLLSMGVFVGAQQSGDTDMDTYDISAGLFSVNEQEFSFDAD